MGKGKQTYRLSIVDRWLSDYATLSAAKDAAKSYAARSGELVTVWYVDFGHPTNVWDTNKNK